MHYLIQNKSNDHSQPIKIIFCDKFFCKLKGLMFKERPGTTRRDHFQKQ